MERRREGGGGKRCLQGGEIKVESYENREAKRYGMERRRTQKKEKDNLSHHTRPGSHQIVIWVAVVASITEGLSESLPRCLSSCHCRGSQSALSHSLTLVPITQLYTDCLAGPAAISHTYLWDNLWQNKDWLKEWQTALCIFFCYRTHRRTHTGGGRRRVESGREQKTCN